MSIEIFPSQYISLGNKIKVMPSSTQVDPQEPNDAVLPATLPFALQS